MVDRDHRAAARHIGRHALHRGTVRQMDVGLHRHRHADRLATLLILPRNGEANAEDHHVEEHPDQIHHNRSRVGAVIQVADETYRNVPETRDRHQNPKDVHADHQQKRLSDAAIEERPVHHSALRRYIEAA